MSTSCTLIESLPDAFAVDAPGALSSTTPKSGDFSALSGISTKEQLLQ